MEQEPGMAKKRGIVTEQSERGPDGVLRAVLDREVTTPQPIIALERVRSVRHGKRRATQLLSAATKNADLTSPARRTQRSRAPVHPQPGQQRNPWRVIVN
jgi:hypothetical protein